jgi:hypothetical protein
MSESERFEAQGRAHAGAKRLRSEIATASAEVARLNRRLADLTGRIDQFLRQPCGQDPGRPVANAAEIAHSLRFEMGTALSTMATLVDEIYAKAEEVAVLEEQIKKF